YDEFATFYVNKECLWNFDRKLPLVYKGVELHANDAVERDFKRSVEQLRYASPVAVLRALELTVDDTLALFFGKVIVTNARLMMVHDGIDIRKIQEANSLEDVAQEVGAAILLSKYGPDYERHFRGVFSKVTDEMKGSAKDLDKYVRQKRRGGELFSYPM